MEIINSISQGIIAITSLIICFFAIRGFKLRPSEKLESVQLYHEFKKFYDSQNIGSIITYLSSEDNKDRMRAFRIDYPVFVNKFNTGNSNEALLLPETVEIIYKLRELMIIFMQIFMFCKNFELIDKKFTPIYSADVKKTQSDLGDIINHMNQDKSFFGGIMDGYNYLLQIAQDSIQQ